MKSKDVNNRGWRKKQIDLVLFISIWMLHWNQVPLLLYYNFGLLILKSLFFYYFD